MIREFVLQGLNCANCAAGIEDSVRKLDGVSHASVNFLTATLRIEIAGSGSVDLHKKIANIVRRHEPDIRVFEKANSIKAENTNDANVQTAGAQIARLIAGAVILAFGIASERFFEIHGYVHLAIFVFGYLLLGGDVVLRAARNIARGKIFDENFLMSVATIGAFAIGEYAEAVGVMLFYQVGEFFQGAAVRRSKKSITALMDIRPDRANVIRNGGVEQIAPELAEIGEHILVKPGEKIPLDGVVIEGESFLDTKSLTGESLPRGVKPGDTALSGCVNQNGLLKIEVTKPFGQSTVAKIIDLVEHASARKAPTESFITKFSRYYTPAVVLLAALLAVIPPLLSGGGWYTWIHRGLVFLVISCPCALVISIPLGFFAGIGGASRQGILVKGGNYLEALGDLHTIVFDKTGTLTKGVFEVTEIRASEGFSQARVLELAAHAESYSNHPIAMSVRKAYGGQINSSLLSGHTEIAGRGVSVGYNGAKVLAGNAGLLEAEGIMPASGDYPGTTVHIAHGGRYAGCIVISDGIKPDSRDAIKALKAGGIRRTVMLTGDSEAIAREVAGALSIDEVHAQLLPADKAAKLEAIKASINTGHGEHAAHEGHTAHGGCTGHEEHAAHEGHAANGGHAAHCGCTAHGEHATHGERMTVKRRNRGKLAFVGDGVNDAPVLALADVGIAMGGLGSDAAIEAADIVLMTDEPSKLVTAMEISRKTRRVVWQNIVFSLGVKAIVLALGAFGAATMWEAVFADVGVALLAVLNAMRVLRSRPRPAANVR